ncbi:hypothetical protein [uncultured Roseobacter sp.]|uniref:hypothetical protein n=1 Tax=uncultured Roseobacter sp. TaxID=114847 RepID=UPI00261FF4B4|nr:hypothetical protein [uncultured Roseobacter sp.]
MRLPLILAGPIVRRATPEKIWVWLATSELLDPPHLMLFTDGNSPTSPGPVKAKIEYYPVAVADNMWIYMLSATPDTPLDRGRIYFYDVRLDGTRPLFKSDDYRQFLLKGNRLPTFMLGARGQNNLRALYGSCRKLHGPNPDMMKAADEILQDATEKNRPQYFFLGGDQIYADDVDSQLLVLTRPLRDALFGGKREIIPGLSPVALSDTIDRSKFLEHFFTSGHMPHHLLTFAEYAATYIMSWNGDLWEPLLKAGKFSSLDKADFSNRIIGKRVLDGALGAKSARRVLANSICYMIFDDHEVTDDWFLNPEWQLNATKFSSGQRILTNGMAAYWAFQGWGNDPEAFDDTYRSTISRFAETRGRGTEDAWSTLIKTDWSFAAPTSPPAIFLDTRTKREESPKTLDIDRADRGLTGPITWTTLRLKDAPRLLDSGERARLTALISKHSASGEPLIVIAAAPIFGFPPMEWVQRVIGRESGTAADLESWASNPRNFIDAFDLFLDAQPNPLIVLSGDVHYGFEIVGRMSTASQSVPFVQLCSSAMKNEIIGGSKFFFKIISLFGESVASFGFWDLKEKGKTDGPIAYTETSDFANGVFSNKFKSSPHYLLQTQFIKRSGRRSVKQLVERQNNLGELLIRGQQVSHRHWHPSSAGPFSARSFKNWNTGNWPIPDMIRALRALFGS